MTSVVLSNGRTANFPDTVPEQRARDLGEQYLTRQTGGQPRVVGDRIYSSTASYPNNAIGHTAAWVDTHLGGNELNQAAESVARTLEPVRGSVGRVATTASLYGLPEVGQAAALTDLGITGVNAAKQIASGYVPSLQQYKDIPTLLSLYQNAAGIEPMPADAPLTQRVIENAISAAVSPSSIASRTVPSSAIRAGASTLGSSAASQLASEYYPDAEKVASLIGGGAGGIATSPRFIAQSLAHPNAKRIQQAADESGIHTSFHTLANSTGQKISNVLGAIPFFGRPIANANERVAHEVQALKDVNSDIMASGPVAGRSNEATIGADHIQGAREAAAQIRAGLSGDQEHVDTTMQGRDVNARPVAEVSRDMTSGNKMSPSNAAAVQGKTDELISMTPGGSNYDAASRGAPVLPSEPTVPWLGMKDWRTGLTYDLQKKDVKVPDWNVAQLRDAATESMQDAADQAGVGPQFKANNATYAQMKPILTEIENVGGKKTGPFNYTKGMDEGQAYTQFEGMLNSPSAMANFVDNYPGNWFGRVAGGYTSMMGEQPDGSFRPDYFAKQWNALPPEVKAMFTQGKYGYTSSALKDLDNAATVGANTATPATRHGLTSSLVIGGAVEQALHHGTAALGHILGVPGTIAGGTALPYFAARGIESPSFKAAMTADPQSLAGQVYSNAPYIAMPQTQQQQMFYGNMEYDPNQPDQNPPGYAEGGEVPQGMSPSRGMDQDDVPARLTAKEFVIPEDVASHLGSKYLTGLVQRTRQQMGAPQQPIGGQRGQTFVSRPGSIGYQLGGLIGQFAGQTPSSFAGGGTVPEHGDIMGYARGGNVAYAPATPANSPSGGRGGNVGGGYGGMGGGRDVGGRGSNYGTIGHPSVSVTDAPTGFGTISLGASPALGKGLTSAAKAFGKGVDALGGLTARAPARAPAATADTAPAAVSSGSLGRGYGDPGAKSSSAVGSPAVSSGVYGGLAGAKSAFGPTATSSSPFGALSSTGFSPSNSVGMGVPGFSPSNAIGTLGGNLGSSAFGISSVGMGTAPGTIGATPGFGAFGGSIGQASGPMGSFGGLGYGPSMGTVSYGPDSGAPSYGGDFGVSDGAADAATAAAMGEGGGYGGYGVGIGMGEGDSGGDSSTAASVSPGEGTSGPGWARGGVVTGDTKKTGTFHGKSNALGHGGRAAQLEAKGVPGGVIGAIARAKGAAPGQKNYHGGYAQGGPVKRTPMSYRTEREC